MPVDASLSRAIAVVGPTAAGKSELAMALALRLRLPILCCDSVQVFRRLDIGSAKPGAEARATVRHELLDLVDPDESFSAGDYATLAREQLRRGPAVICGGTGFYLRAAAWAGGGEEALDDRSRDDPARAGFETDWAEKERVAPGATHAALAAIDPETAAGIHPNNVVRATRALWLNSRSEVPLALLRKRRPPFKQFEFLMIFLDPGVEPVDRAIARRTDAMIEAGWVAEVENLLADGYDPRYKALRSLGYRQLAEFLAPQHSPESSTRPTDLPAVIEDIKGATRQYARRQRTFFRHQFRTLDPEHIVHLADPSQCPIERAEQFLRGEAP